MSIATHVDNRVKTLRQARGWSQQQLAQAAGLSRTGVSAIEARRLMPSVAAALGLARALDCTVEELFGDVAGRHLQRQERAARFAWLPSTFPCRYWAAEVAGKTWLFPVESGPCGGVMHDGVARSAEDLPPHIPLASMTTVLATCDPAAGYLAALYSQQSGFRILVFTRTSREALALVEQDLVHAAGVHFAAAGDRDGNAAAIRQRGAGRDLSLLKVAMWEEGIALAPQARQRTADAARRASLRWVGRPPGAGARRCQDEVLAGRASPRRIAHDHRGVVEAIKNGWADAGVCVRLACEEAHLSFLPVCEEPYELCFPSNQATEPRMRALVATIRSPAYRGLLADLPGYRTPAAGELQVVPGGASAPATSSTSR